MRRFDSDPRLQFFEPILEEFQHEMRDGREQQHEESYPNQEVRSQLRRFDLFFIHGILERSKFAKELRPS